MINKFFYKIRKINNIYLFKSTTHLDKRGEIWSIFLQNKIKFNFDKFTRAKKNSLRGFHGDNKTWKLITCLDGECLSCIVDFNKKSKFYLKKYYFKLSKKNKLSVLIPPKMLLGWTVLSNSCLFFYKMSFKGKYNDVKNQISIKWDDKLISANWPKKKFIISKRDS
jgi:dTDP-4-dehydrorhamnose 3,5-epimerase